MGMIVGIGVAEGKEKRENGVYLKETLQGSVFSWIFPCEGKGGVEALMYFIR